MLILRGNVCVSYNLPRALFNRYATVNAFTIPTWDGFTLARLWHRERAKNTRGLCLCNKFAARRPLCVLQFHPVVVAAWFDTRATWASAFDHRTRKLIEGNNASRFTFILWIKNKICSIKCVCHDCQDSHCKLRANKCISKLRKIYFRKYYIATLLVNVLYIVCYFCREEKIL